MEVESALSSYRIFNAVAEAGNISKAAKELYISQPAISKAVSKLEQSLSVKLFIRNSRGVKLTEEGNLLYEYTSSAFEALRRGEESLKKMRQFDTENIKISISTSLCKYILLPRLQDFIGAYPHIKVAVECRSSQEATTYVEHGKADLCLLEAADCPKGLNFEPVKILQDTFVVSPKYPGFSSVPPDKNVPPEFLRESVFLLPEEKGITRSYGEKLFSRYDIRSEKARVVNTMDLLIDFSKIGMGIGCVPKEYVKEELASGALEELKTVLPETPHTIGFAYKKQKKEKESLQHLIDFYKGDDRL